MKRLFYIASSLLSVCLTACHESESKTQETEPVKVKIQKVYSSAITNTTYYSGTVEEESGSILSFPLMGTIDKLCVKPGDRVREGQLIASLNPVSIENSYKAAQSTLQQAKDVFQRMKELHDKGSLPEIKWIEAQTKLKQAESMETIARKNLQDTKLYAPYSGIISEKLVEAGQNTAPGLPVVKLISTGQVKVTISVPETEIANISLNRKALIKVPAIGNQNFEGEITEKGIQADPLSHSYKVKIRINQADTNLMPGMVSEVILIKENKTPQFTLPVNAIQLDENNRYFVWINENGKAIRRTIVCTNFTAKGVIATGLNEGDEVIVEGQHKVCTGTPLYSL